MKILVVGASQGTGALAVQAALDKGHEVTAFARTPAKLAIDSPRLTKVAGNFHDRASVDAAVRGHDAVIVTASAVKLSAFRENPRYFSQGTEYVIEAMKAHGARRLAILSALGVGETRPLLPPILGAIVTKWILRAAFEDHERQEKMVRESGVDWVIARPGRLTNGPAQRKYVKTAAIEKVPSAIARADVADFLVVACETDTWVQHGVQLGG
jgi:uncharacterized protein YbjT (DUF2867 family)